MRHAGGKGIGRQQIIFAIPVDIVTALLQIAEEIGFVGMQTVKKAAMTTHLHRPTREKTAA
jgi:hypothetical protein